MAMDTNTKGFITVLPWTLALHLLIPYAVIASGYRGLVWAWESKDPAFTGVFGVLLLCSLLSSLSAWRLMRIGTWFYRAGIVLALAHTAYIAMVEKRHSLLILIFALFALGIFLAEKMERVLKQPFYFSRRKWWESYPKSLPGLHAEIFKSEKADEGQRVRLSNFGSEGCFVFSEERKIPFIPGFVRIYSGDKILLETPVDTVIQTSDQFGCGLRFSGGALDGDWSKDLKDYLGFLRRSGYEVS